MAKMIDNGVLGYMDMDTLVSSIFSAVYASENEIRSFIESKARFDAASIYYLAVHHFPRRVNIWR